MCDCENKPLTQADMRRIAREEIVAALLITVDRGAYNHHSGLKVNGTPVLET